MKKYGVIVIMLLCVAVLPSLASATSNVTFAVIDQTNEEYLDNFCVDIVDEGGTETLCTSGTNVTTNRTENTLINVTMYPQVAGEFYNVTKTDVNVSDFVTDEPLYMTGGYVNITVSGTQNSWATMGFSYEQSYPYVAVFGSSSWTATSMSWSNSTRPFCCSVASGEVGDGEYFRANFGGPLFIDNDGTNLGQMSSGARYFAVTYVNETYLKVESSTTNNFEDFLSQDSSKTLEYEGPASIHTGTKTLSENIFTASSRNLFFGIVEGKTVVFQTKMFPAVTNIQFRAANEATLIDDDMEGVDEAGTWGKGTTAGGDHTEYSTDFAYTGSQSLKLIASTNARVLLSVGPNNVTYPVRLTGAFYDNGGSSSSAGDTSWAGFQNEVIGYDTNNPSSQDRRELSSGGFGRVGSNYQWFRPESDGDPTLIDTGVATATGNWYTFDVYYKNETYAEAYLNGTLVYNGTMSMPQGDNEFNWRVTAVATGTGAGGTDKYLDDIVLVGANASESTTSAVWNMTTMSAFVEWSDTSLTGSYEVRNGSEVLKTGTLPTQRRVWVDVNALDVGETTITVFVNETFDGQVGEGQNTSALNVSKLTSVTNVQPSGTTVSTQLFNTTWTAAQDGVGTLVYDVLLEIAGANVSVVNDTSLTTQEVDNLVEDTARMWVRSKDDYFTTEYVASAAPFTVNFVQNLTDVVCTALTFPNELNAPSIAKIPVNFTVTKEGGLSSPAVNVSLTLSGSTFYLDTCTESVVSGSESDFNCTVPMQFYYEPGLYSINVTVVDNGDTVTQIESGVCEYGSLVASQRQVDTITFPGAGPGIDNIMGDPNLSIRNTGNVQFNLSLTAYDLEGRTVPTDELLASYFEAGQSLPFAVQLTDGVNKDLNMSVTNGASEVGQIGLWLSMPSDANPQEYFTPTAWQLVATG